MTRSLLFSLLLGLGTCSDWRRPSCEQVFDNVKRLEKERQPGQALLLIEKELERRAADSASACYWNLYFQRADMVLKQKGPEAALRAVERDIPAQVRTAELEARRKMLQGWAQFKRADYGQARRLLDAAYGLAMECSCQWLIPQIELRRAPLLAILHDDAGAARSLEAARHLGDRDPNLQASLYGSYGFKLAQALRFEEAQPWFEKAAPLAEAQGDERMLAAALLNLGWCYYELGELDRALDKYTSSLEINRRIHDRDGEKICLGQIGGIYFDWRDLEKAKVYYQQALDLARRWNARDLIASSLSNLARVAIEQRDWSAAEAYNREALKLKRELNEKDAALMSLLNQAEIENGRGGAATAKATFTEVLDERSENPIPNIAAHAGLAKIYRQAGDLARAEGEFKFALSLIDGARSHLNQDSNKLSYGSNLTDVESDYVALLMSQGKTELALEATEVRRARMLTERVDRDRPRKALHAADYRKIARDSGRVLLSYFLGPERSFVWVVLPGRIEGRTLAAEPKITRLVENYRAQIENFADPLDSDSGVGPELYSLLVAPVSDVIPKGSRVVIVPDGSLHALNMETLVALEPTPHYWAQDVTVSVAPSLNVLVPGAQPNHRRPALLLIGDPLEVSHYPKLTFASAEIDTVQKFFPGALIFRDKAATRGAYLNSRPERFSHIHFSAHGTADAKSPLDSAIILSGADGKYRLTAADVLTRPLRADLVTISACDSAGARTYAGEGLVGFTWTFFQAGAGNVIAGLWDVSDESTPGLMEKLYGSVARGVAPDRALREAKLNMLGSNTRYHVPYYWAAFQLYARRLI